ncbi:MAG TPA: DUF1330 domain-containing protein [Polyangiales bacterium]|nr:DUF1330 domain-containing protein [Polyangiales bacterium]
MLEVTWGLQVDDAALYADYRAAMKPILSSFEGAFVLDLWVAERLLAPTDAPFNRLFTIRFASERSMEAFFAHPDYLAAKRTFFTRSVSSVSELSRRSL